MCWCNVYPDILYSFLSKNGRTEWEYAYDKLTDLVFLEDFFSNQENERDLLSGCLVNALTSAKRFMEKNKVAGVILAITAVVLLVLSAMCFAAVLK